VADLSAAVPRAGPRVTSARPFRALDNETRQRDTNHVKRDRVNSSSVASVGYDEAQHVLDIEFHNGNVYRYLDVPAAVHRLLLHAQSIGEFVNTIVKPKFETIRME
jgi:lysyl-tRNA synthetase class 2